MTVIHVLPSGHCSSHSNFSFISVSWCHCALCCRPASRHIKNSLFTAILKAAFFFQYFDWMMEIVKNYRIKWKVRVVVMLALDDCCSLWMNSCRSDRCLWLREHLRWVHYWTNWMESLLLLVRMVWWFAIFLLCLTSPLLCSLCDGNANWLRTLVLQLRFTYLSLLTTSEQKIQDALFVLNIIHLLLWKW